jgi:hypothetical protein
LFSMPKPFLGPIFKSISNSSILCYITWKLNFLILVKPRNWSFVIIKTKTNNLFPIFFFIILFLCVSKYYFLIYWCKILMFFSKNNSKFFDKILGKCWIFLCSNVNSTTFANFLETFSKFWISQNWNETLIQISFFQECWR